MFVLKNGHAAEVSVANCHAKLSHLKQLLKNIHPVILAQFCLTDEKIYSGHTEKPKESSTVRNCSNQEERRHDKTLAHDQTVTDGISLRVTSGRENTSLIHIDHGVKVIEGC